MRWNWCAVNNWKHAACWPALIYVDGWGYRLGLAVLEEAQLGLDTNAGWWVQAPVRHTLHISLLPLVSANVSSITQPHIAPHLSSPTPTPAPTATPCPMPHTLHPTPCTPCAIQFTIYVIFNLCVLHFKTKLARLPPSVGSAGGQVCFSITIKIAGSVGINISALQIIKWVHVSSIYSQLFSTIPKVGFGLSQAALYKHHFRYRASEMFAWTKLLAHS